MAYFFYTDSGPGYLLVVPEYEKIRAASTETFEEYLATNRLGFPSLERITLDFVIYYSLHHGYPAKVKCLYYHTLPRKKIEQMAPKEKILKYDGLPTAGIRVPIMKTEVADIFKEFCGDKVQILDVVIRLQNGEELHDYKALNAINRVEAFTWEGSEKNDYYNENDPCYNSPHIASMKMMAYRNEVVEREIICQDSVTNVPNIMICDALAHELKKRKFKGLRFTQDTGYGKFV